MADASPASYCVPVCSAPGPDPVVPLPVTVTAPATVSTAPVSVTVPASAPVTYPANTIIYVGPPVPTEGPFPFPEFAGDPEAIDRWLRGYVKRIVTTKVKEIETASAWTQDNTIRLENIIIRTFCISINLI